MESPGGGNAPCAPRCGGRRSAGNRGSGCWRTKGDALRGDILQEIVRAGGEVNGSCLSDEAVDWVEAVANGEDPAPIVRETR